MLSENHTGPFTLLDLELADHDDDGSEDLGYAVSTKQTNVYAVESMRGNGDGSFGDVYPQLSGYVSGVPPLLDKGDVLGVGEEGFVVAALTSVSSFFTSAVYTFGYRGDGPTPTKVGGYDYEAAALAGVTVGDWNGDGVDDPAIGDAENSQILRWLSIGEDGLWAPLGTQTDAGNQVMGIAAGDWDGDGDDDVMALYGLGEGYETFTGPLAGTTVPFDSVDFLIEPVGGDFDGDGLATSRVSPSRSENRCGSGSCGGRATAPSPRSSSRRRRT